MFYDWLHNEIRLEWAMEEANRVNKEHYVHEQTEYALSRVPTLAAPDAASAAAAAVAGGGGAPDGQGLQPRADGEPASRMRSNLSNEPSKTPPVAGAGERPITHKSGRAQERVPTRIYLILEILQYCVRVNKFSSSVKFKFTSSDAPTRLESLNFCSRKLSLRLNC